MSDGVTGWRQYLTALETEIIEAERLQIREVVRHLVTQAQVARAWGYNSATAVNNMASRLEHFPDPVGVFGNVPVYWAPEVDEFMRQYRESREQKQQRVSE